ncbi:MAG: hypothetical protein N3F63_03880 [Thermoplasmata archaeon]|nr:hypothetical protein [Thermoplasmata archaeon]
MVEEVICTVEFIKQANIYLARVQSEVGGVREYKSNSINEVLEQVVIDLQEEFEASFE